MSLLQIWTKGLSPQDEPDSLDATSPEEVANSLRFLGVLGLFFLSLTVAALTSGLVVLVISRLGGGSGLPVLGFRGAVALALVGTWSSIGDSETRPIPQSDLPKFLANTLAQQVGCSLVMLVLVGLLSLLLKGIA